MKDNFKSLDFSFDLGGGAEYQVSADASIFADIRYSLGVSDVNDVSPGRTINLSGIRIIVGVLLSP